MREITSSTENFTRKDFINCRNAESLQDIDDRDEFSVVACAIIRVEDEDELRNVAIFKTPESRYISTISYSVIEIAEDVIEIIDAGEQVTCRLLKRTSKGGRTFLSLIVL